MQASRSKNVVIAVLAAIIVAGGILAWNQYEELIRLRAASLDPTLRSDLQKRLWALEKRNNELAAQLANLRAREASLGQHPADDSANSDANGRPVRPAFGGRFGRRNLMDNLSVLLQDPKFNKLWTQQQQDRIKLAYAGLFKALNLAPDQAGKLENLLVERQQSLMDVLAAARDQGGVSRSEIGTLLQQANSQIDGQIQSLLGPDGYAQYTNYLQTAPQRNQVNELQTRLAAQGIQPLQDYQTQQLVQILAQGSPQSGQGGGPRGGGFIGVIGGMFGGNVTGPAIGTGAVTQASGVLTSDQLQVLQQMQQQQAAQQQIRNALRQSFSNGAQTGAAPLTPAATAPGGGG